VCFAVGVPAKKISTTAKATRPGPAQARRVRTCLAQDPAADALLDRDPFALLAGMVLDQQFPLERAFAGPRVIADRLGVDTLDVRAIAAHDEADFVALCSRTPAIHRFPGSMAKRIQAVARHLIECYDGEPTALWETAGTGAELLKRLKAVPGFGDQKARIFLALLAKQRGVCPPGWEAAAGPYGEAGSRRSVADIVDAATLAEVRAYKQDMKRAARAAAAD
jgi:uncharacterized HhH-GPD family protein